MPARFVQALHGRSVSAAVPDALQPVSLSPKRHAVGEHLMVSVWWPMPQAHLNHTGLDTKQAVPPKQISSEACMASSGLPVP